MAHYGWMSNKELLSQVLAQGDGDTLTRELALRLEKAEEELAEQAQELENAYTLCSECDGPL